MFLFCRTQRKIFWRKFVTRLFWGNIDFSSLTYIVGKKKTIVPQNCSVSHILQNILICVQQNKHIHTGLELRGDTWCHNSLFWVNYPFKIPSDLMLMIGLCPHQCRKTSKLILQGCIKWIKSDSKGIYKIFLFQICSFNYLIIIESWNNCITVYTILRRITWWMFEEQISIFEWFLKDHVTLIDWNS